MTTEQAISWLEGLVQDQKSFIIGDLDADIKRIENAEALRMGIKALEFKRDKEGNKMRVC